LVNLGVEDESNRSMPLEEGSFLTDLFDSSASGVGAPGSGGGDVFDFYSSLFEIGGPSKAKGDKKRDRDERHGDSGDERCQDVEQGGIAAILARAEADPLEISKRAKAPPRALSTGHQLLKNLGWEDGTGLGSSRQGILEPVGA